MANAINSEASWGLHGEVNVILVGPKECQQFDSGTSISKTWNYQIRNFSNVSITVTVADIVSGLTPEFSVIDTVLPISPIVPGGVGDIAVTIDYDGTEAIYGCHPMILNVTYS